MSEQVISYDLGYWGGGITYQPSWSPTPLSITFGQVDPNGVAWLWMSIDGWDSPDVSGSVVQRASDHGGWATPQYYAPRTMTLTVMASAPTQAARDFARAQLQQVIPINDLCTLTYAEPQPKQSQMRRAGKISETYPDLVNVQFQCVIVAPDPRKYNTVQRSISTILQDTEDYLGVVLPTTLPIVLPAAPVGGSVICTNNGTFETRPVITITGPVTAPSVANLSTGQTVSFTALTLNTGDTLVIDMDLRTPYLNGALRNADIMSSWWVLNPGPNTILFGGQSTGGATMSVQYADAWI